jgi:hypothetical protein
MDIQLIIKLASQVIFGVAALVFTVYSIAAIYALNTYGQKKSVTSSLSILYSAAVAGLLSWGLAVILTN